MARKILLADDSVTAQNMGRKILSDAGYEVIAVNNGSAALKKIAELKPDLVILDVYMPGYSGLEVCQRLKDVQDTARIPVLLTVGKLEPFKPEEAQRVRAEGYIVKPFEASELLSALSKLEDKVVPRAEPSRPGRFARAIASVEAASRGRKSELPVDRRSESRIGFPHEKTGREEAIADESSFYNPMNRDLRTTVETSAERAAHQRPEEKVAPVGNRSETSVDLAALAPEGLPHSVTPEEVFAIAAAAAQIQMAEGAFTEEQRAPDAQTEFQVAPAESSATTSSEVSISEAPSAEVSDSGNHVAEVSVPRNSISGTVAEIPSEPSSESLAEDEPVTIAATAESVLSENSGASRWTAVSVALEGDEATVSLEQQMQKAYGARAVADPALAASVAEGQAAPAANSAAAAMETEAGTPAPVVAISNSEAETVAEAVGGAESTEIADQPVVPMESASEAGSVAPEEATQLHEAADDEPVIQASVAELSSPQAYEHVEPNLAGSLVEESPAFDSPPVAAAQSEVGASNAQSEQERIAHDTADVATAKAVADSEALAPTVRDAVTTESSLDADTVKNAATAWASWRQIRDTGKSNESAEPQPEKEQMPVWSQAEVEEVQSNDVAASSEFQQGEVPQSEVQPIEVQSSEAKPGETQFGESEAPATAEISAWAVAAGAEQIPQEASSTTSDNNANDVANIVDSVLAGLRPKLMAEIARKMAEKK
ncbi:MAG: response regulator [Candidatus Sulfotelmatobacter sp.]